MDINTFSLLLFFVVFSSEKLIVQLILHCVDDDGNAVLILQVSTYNKVYFTISNRK